jgi:transposase InsO family protein
VYRLMKDMKLPKMSTVKPPRHKSVEGSSGPCKNLLTQRFDQKAPNMVWVCDFTYVKVAGRFHYVCAILDLYSRKVIACRVSNHIDSALAIQTLRDAVRLRGVSHGVMFHTDQGSQFTSADFRKVIDELDMIQSFSAKGHPYDNAVMECFFKYLKKEELDRRSFQTVEQLKQSLISYISGFYNSVRPHSHNGGLTPNQVDALYVS